MKRLMKASVSKVYIVYLLLLTVFVIGTYSSYAYFIVNKEKKNAIKMITGNLVGELKVDGEANDKLVVNANETKTFEIELINKNNREARFNFYYKGSLPDNVEAGYVSGDGYNSMVKEVGVSLTANGTLGYFLKYQIKVKNNTSGNVTIPIGYSIGLDYNNLSLPSNCYLFEEMKDEKAVNVLLANYTNSESVQDYNVNYTKTDSTAKENKMYVFNHEAGTQQQDWSSDELKDYRYIGKDPNNYVTFNNETAGWRIIGIETVDDGTGTKEKRIKLIRKDPLPIGTDNYLSWDNKPSETGTSTHSYGSNDWYDSRLMYLLNPNHESEQTGVSGSIYWNHQSGNCPKGQKNATTSCDFTSTGLKEEAQQMIGEEKWYLGGTTDYGDANNGTANHFYEYERGEKTCTTTGKCKKTRKMNWTGRVGLIYPSDYGYATSGGSTKDRNSCLATEMHDWWYGSNDCYNNDWLLDSNDYQWTIAPYSGDSYDVFRVDTGGFVSFHSVYDSCGARPVVYLKASTLYESGDGSQSNPFVFEHDPSIDDEGPVCKFTEYPDNFSSIGTDGTIQVECTDNSGSLANDLTSDAIVGVNPQNDFIPTVILTNTETIENGKRYTFNITIPAWSFDGCISSGNYFKIKAYSVKDKAGNGNSEIRQVLNVTTRETCASSGEPE